MKMKNLIIFSGVGTISEKTDYSMFEHNENYKFIQNFIKNNDLNENQTYCLNIISIQICLFEMWNNWGIKADIIFGHSFGELAAACVSGLINLFDIINIAVDLGKIVSQQDGWLCHGYDMKLIENTFYSSINFKDENGIHTTVCGLNDSLDDFIKLNPNSKKMYVKNPWHHPIYSNKYSEPFKQQKCKIDLYLCSIFDRVNILEQNHWNNWLSNKSDVIKTVENFKKKNSEYSFNIIEIGAHPVMYQMISSLKINKFVSSMHRECEAVNYLIENRKNLIGKEFIKLVKKACHNFDSNLLLDKPVLLQNYNSLKITQLSEILLSFFPKIGPEDLYRFGSINNIINDYGKKTDVKENFGNICKKYDDDPIVIIATSCILPYEIYSINDLWDKLINGFDGIRVKNDFDNLPCGFIDDLYFNNDKFNISKKETMSMDPQQILALILSDFLFQDSNVSKENLNGSNTGVYMGVWNTDYPGNKSSAYYAIGKNPSIISARISSYYNLTGPSKVINTACSSSLESVYDAVKDIRLGIVDYAIAGGVNMLWSKEFTHCMKKSRFLGESGRCKTFDNSADGYVRSEGGGLILLCRKSKVDKYYAEILGGSTNHNGYQPLITVPSSSAQEKVILKACMDSNIKPDQIDYIECHGTGTKIGDPIEISALRNIISNDRKKPCYIGSIKSNIGHLESGAGISGIIKSILILCKQIIPKSIHISKINENLKLHNGLKIVENKIKTDINIIGISSFGFGGSNAHIILKKSSAIKKFNNIKYNTYNTMLISRIEINNSIKQNNCINQPETIKKNKSDKLIESKESKELAKSYIINNKIIEYEVKNNFFKLMNDLGIIKEEFEKPIINLNIDSLSLTEFIVQIEEEFYYKIDVLDISKYKLSCKNIFNKIIGISHNIEINKDFLNNCDNNVCILYNMNDINILLDELNIDIDFNIPLIDNDIDSLSLTELIIQLEERFSILVDISEISKNKLSLNNLLNNDTSINTKIAEKPCKISCKNTSKNNVNQNKSKYTKSNTSCENTINLDYYHYTKILDPKFKIKTTHVGSLPKKDDDTMVSIIEKQLNTGIDIVNDGELSRKSYASEILNSLTGFEDKKSQGPLPKDLKECSGCSKRFLTKTSLITLNPNIQTMNPACTGPIKYTNLINLQFELNKYLLSLKINGVSPENSFYTVPSPGTIAIFFENQYYDTEDIYFEELSKNLKKEYEEIVNTGINLQIDCPDLAMGRHTKYQDYSERQFIDILKRNIHYLNKALENIDANKVRMHICWGNYSSLHNFDINIRKIIKEIFKAKPKQILLESSNHGHSNDIEVFKDIKFPEDKTLVLGVVDTSSRYVETPELISTRLINAASIVGKERLMACPDCGFSTTSDSSGIDSEIVWLKLNNMVEGAKIATKKLSKKNIFSKRPLIRIYVFGNIMLEYNDLFEIRKVPDNYNSRILIEHFKNYVDIPIVFMYTKNLENNLQALCTKIKNTRYYPNELIIVAKKLSKKKKQNIFKSLIEKYNKVDKSKLVVSNSEKIKKKYDIVVIGAGLTGLYCSYRLKKEGYEFCLLEKNDQIGGIWNNYANFTSQVNTSEAAYRIIDEDRNKINRDHTTPREIINDVGLIKESIKNRIFVNHEVIFVEKKMINI